MTFTDSGFDTPIYFKSYNDNGFELNIGNYDGSLILSREEIINVANDIISYEDIKDKHIELIAEARPEIVIIGTGDRSHIPIDMINKFAQKSISIDFMDTNTACKTYNLLANENRKVVALIIK